MLQLAQSQTTCRIMAAVSPSAEPVPDKQGGERRGTGAEETPGVSAHATPGAQRAQDVLLPGLLKVDLTGRCKQGRLGVFILLERAAFLPAG